MPTCYYLWEPAIFPNWGSHGVGLFKHRKDAIAKAHQIMSRSEFGEKGDHDEMEETLSQGSHPWYSYIKNGQPDYHIAIQEMKHNGSEDLLSFYLLEDYRYVCGGCDSDYHLFATRDELIDYIIAEMQPFQPTISPEEIRAHCQGHDFDAIPYLQGEQFVDKYVRPSSFSIHSITLEASA